MAAELCECPYCNRPRIVVDRDTGWRMRHYRVRSQPGSGVCDGSSRHRDSTPGTGVAR